MLLIHPAFAHSHPETAKRIAAAEGKPLSDMLFTRRVDGEHVVAISDDVPRIWAALKVNARIVVHHTSGVEELPNISGKEWRPLSKNATSLWAQFYKLSTPQRFSRPYAWADWISRCAAGTWSWGEWTMPHLKKGMDWRPSCWLNLRDSHLWCGAEKLIADTLVSRKQVKAFIRESDKMFDGKLHRHVLCSDGYVRFQEAPGVLHFDPRIQGKDDEKRLTVSLKTAIERLPYEASVQAYVNAWPLKYLPREYLKWLVYDGQIGSEEGETETLKAPLGERANSKTVYQRYSNGERLLTPQSMIRQMWTSFPTTQKGKLNVLHFAVKNWLKESECDNDSLSPLPEGFCGSYNHLPMSRVSAHANTFATTDDLDMPEWREFYGSGRWGSEIIRPILCAETPLKISLDDDPRWVKDEEGGWHYSPTRPAIYGEWQNEFVSTGKSDSRHDPFANQGSPVWIMPDMSAYYKGMNRKGNRIRRAIAEGDDDPSPWQLGLVENDETGKPQVRDLWTGPKLEETLMDDYVPPEPSDDPTVNFRRAVRVRDEMEATAAEEMQFPGGDFWKWDNKSKMWCLLAATLPAPTPPISEQQHRKDMAVVEWEERLAEQAPAWSPAPLKPPVYHEASLNPLEDEIEKLRAEKRDRPDFSHMQRRGPHPSVVSVLMRCEEKAIRICLRRQEKMLRRDMKRQRRLQERHLERTKNATTDIEYELSCMPATPENWLLRDIMRAASRQWSTLPEGAYGVKHGTTSTLWNYENVKRHRTQLSKGARKFEEMFA